MFNIGDVVRHKGGGIYTITNRCVIASGSEPIKAYAYKGGDHPEIMWVRAASEMEDGRFTLQQKASAEVHKQ